MLSEDALKIFTTAGKREKERYTSRSILCVILVEELFILSRVT